MGLESATYISDLDSNNPLGTDARSTSDDHHRLVKAVLLASFPNVDGEVTATAATMNDVFVNAVMNNAANTMSGGSIDMAANIIDNAKLQSYAEVFVNMAAVQSNSSATIDYSVANNFVLTVSTATLTMAFSNWPSTGIKGTVNVEVIQDATGGRMMKYPAAVKWSGGVKPPIAQSIGAVSSFSFTTRDGGTTIYGYQTGFHLK